MTTMKEIEIQKKLTYMERGHMNAILKNGPKVGVIFDKRGDPPYQSVGKLWSETINIISDKFRTEIFETDDFYVKSSREYQEFINKIDIMMLLSPYYSIDRSLKKFPIVFYGLGSLQKGGHWLYDNRISFKRYDSIILNSTACQNIYNTLVKKNGMKSYLVPFGVDTTTFYPRSNKLELRRKYNIPEDAFVMVYSGRINIQKNASTLISLMRDLEKEYKCVYLAIIGFFDNFYIPEFSNQIPPDCKTEFYNLVKKFNLSSKIRFFDHQSDPNSYAELLCTADIGINLTTLISENFGYTPVEMQACGLPVIGTDWGGLKDTIIDGETGFHIETVLSNYGARINMKLAKNRIEALINDRELLRGMSDKSRENVEKRYSYKLFSQNIQNTIQETYQEFSWDYEQEDDLKINPVLERLSKALYLKYGGTRHISWEHLHPRLDFQHYGLIASKCATVEAENTIWNEDCYISKGFDWIIEDEEFVSFDPRWNTSFELVDWSLTRDELIFLKQIEHFDSTIKDLLRCGTMQSVELFRMLRDLTNKGLIVPFCGNKLIKVHSKQ